MSTDHEPLHVDHKVEVFYTTDDDGIWLNCSCGWKEHVGFAPTVKALVKAEREHIKAAARDVLEKENHE